MARGPRTKIAKSIYQDAHGISGIVRRLGHTEELRFPLGTSIVAIRQDMQARLDELADDQPAPEAGSVRAIVAHALRREHDRTRRKDRAQLLRPWVDAFRNAQWRLVSRQDLQGVVDDWARDGLSASRIRKRIGALRAAWRSVAPDRAAPHPIERLPLPAEPPATAIRGRPMALVDLVLQNVTQPRSQARLGVLAWTGQPPARVMAIKREHVRWQAKPPELYVSPRRKGKGSADAWLPLLPPAVLWLKRLFADKADGPFTLSPLGRIWHEAIVETQQQLRKAKRRDDAARLNDFRVYDLRHSFLTHLAIVTGDVYVVKEYAGHASIQTTLRYMRGAASARVKSAILSASESSTI